MPPRRSLPPGHVDLWIAPLDRFGAAERSGCLSLLSPDERARYERFRVAEPQSQFLAARGLLRTTLSRYRPIAPQGWRFTANRYGRPFVAPDMAVGDLFFSLSHTEGLVACAVSASAEIGVDAEHLDGRLDHAALASSTFTAAEAGLVADATAEAATATFFAIWTLKEAYIKARGLGVSLPLDGFRFDLSGPDPVIAFASDAVDHPGRWRFRTLTPMAERILSVAVGLPPPVATMTLSLHAIDVLDGSG